MEFAPETQSLQVEATKSNELREKLVEDFTQVLESSVGMNTEIHVVEDIITASPQGLISIFDRVSNKFKAIIGVLVFVASYQISTGAQQAPDEHNFSQEDEFAQSVEKSAEIKKITGIDIAGEAEKVSRGAKLYTPDSPTNLTVVHIGQIHNVGDFAEANWKFRDSITKSQAEISSFVLATTNVSSKVFVEGYTESYIQRLNEGQVHNNLKKVVSQIDSAQSFNEVKDIYDAALSEAPAEQQDAAIINKVTGEKLSSLGFIETSPLVYTKNTEHLALYESGLLPQGKEFAVSNTVDSGLAEAAAELEARGKITISPAEDSSLNQKAFESIEEVTKNNTLTELFTAFGHNSKYHDQIVNKTFSAAYIASDPNFIQEIQTLSQDEKCKDSTVCQQLVKEITEVTIPTARKIAIEDREDRAIELIAKNATTTHQNVFPLVYGDGHDFTRAITKWNATHPNMRFNLVTVK